MHSDRKYWRGSLWRGWDYNCFSNVVVRTGEEIDRWKREWVGWRNNRKTIGIYKYMRVGAVRRVFGYIWKQINALVNKLAAKLYWNRNIQNVTCGRTDMKLMYHLVQAVYLIYFWSCKKNYNKLTDSTGGPWLIHVPKVGSLTYKNRVCFHF
jgi:hypothetical protein